MANKNLATLIAQEVTSTEPTTEDSSAITTTQNAPLAQPNSDQETLFDESKRIWDEFVAFDKEHQLTQRVGAQLWRL